MHDIADLEGRGLPGVFVASTELIDYFTRAAERDGYAVLWTNGSGTWGGGSASGSGRSITWSRVRFPRRRKSIA